MRIVLIALATLLLLGCIAQSQVNPVPPSYAPQNASVNPGPNATVPEQNQTQQNITPGGSLINESNITARNASVGGVSNLSNITLPPAANVTVPNAAENATAQQPSLSFGNYSLVLDDVSIVSSSEPCGIFSITAVNGSVVDRFVTCPRQSHIWKAPDGHTYRIFVEKVAAGYGGVEWADAIVFG